MLDLIQRAFSADGFMPHGMCYLWQPGILSLHVISDALITLAYFSIPFTLLYFVRRRKDLEFDWMFVCFAIFIVACGTTHLMEIWTVWQPVYWLSGSIKAVTALASVPTAILLVRLVPEALRLPSPSALREANTRLEREVIERERAEAEVRRSNEELEARVAERTAQLEAANRKLLEEIRQREQAEETMRSNRQLLEAIVDNSTAVIYVKDLNGRYLLINRRFEEIFHFTREAILGRTDHDLFPPDAADAFRAMDQRVAAVGRALTEEEMAPHHDGLHAYISVKAPLRDDSGKLYAVFGISTDITERKQADERLRAQLKRLDLLDRTTRAIGERQDLRSIFQVVLRSLEEHLQIDFACACTYDPVAPGLSVSCIGPGSQPLACQMELQDESRIEVDQNGMARCIRGELVHEADIGASRFPFPERLARGGLRSLVIAPLIVENKVFGVMVCARRIPASFSSADCEFLRQLTQHVALAAHQAQLYDSLQQAYDDLRQTQRSILQQERLRALGQMASGIAHDINNALSPAALYVQSLLEQAPGLDEQTRERLAIVQRAIEDVANTVARMREFYRPREPQADLAAVDLNRILKHVLELTQVRWRDMPQERGIVIEAKTELQSNVSAIMGAESDIRDAVTNLVLNAVDAMPDGGKLTLRSVHDAAAQRVCIEVCDTGVGMPETVRSRCLEPFFTTKGERGTGLGLAMVYGMVQRHSAELQIDSEPGAGTIVRLSFPSAHAATALHVQRASKPLRPLRILIVDDDPLLLESMQRILEADGHSVEVAEGGHPAIETFVAAQSRREPFAVVITDLGMPHIDGRAVAQAIKSASRDTPVVLLTGWGHRLLSEHDIPEHVDRVLSKPPKLADLRAVLADVTVERHTS